MSESRPRARETFSPAQCRAARGLLDWTPERVAEAAQLEVWQLLLFEAGRLQLAPPLLISIGKAFCAAGVVALAPQLAGAGVRFRVASAPEPVRESAAGGA